MGFREKLTENKQLGIGLGGALVLIAAIAIGYQLSQMGPPDQRPSSGSGAYYSTDDGQTYYEDGVDLIPPYDKGGKQAVRAYVFECGGKKFVAYLERYTPEAQKLLQELKDASKNNKNPSQQPAMMGKAISAQRDGKQVKRPGDKQWVSEYSAAGGKLTTVKCPDGKSEAGIVNP